MTGVQAIFLGILQGLTEFLPVSSSGHLVLTQSFIGGFSQPGVLFDAALHAGTMLAIVIYFRRQILSLTRSMAWLILIGTVPAAVVGLLFQHQLEALFMSVRVVGVALLFTGGMNWLVDKPVIARERKRDRGNLEIASATPRNDNWKIGMPQAFIVGVFQAIAIIPGISRSGSTIFAGVAQGIKREDAATFSFLLSIPAVAGANLLQLVSYGTEGSLPVANYTLGFLAAGVVGYVSIHLLMRLLLAHKFKVFALYTLVLGLTTLAASI